MIIRVKIADIEVMVDYPKLGGYDQVLLNVLKEATASTKVLYDSKLTNG